MGRKRQTRKRTDRVNSKTSLNSGNISSDSESETSLVSRKESQTVFGQKALTNGSADTDCNAPTLPTGASINQTSLGQHCLTGQVMQAERAHTSFDRSVSQENIPSENMHPAQPEHGQHPISVPSDDYDTDQTTQKLPVNTGLGRFVSQLNSGREFTPCNAQPDTTLQSTSLSGETADTDQTIHTHALSTGTNISCGQGRVYLVSHETQRGKSTSYAQADHGLPSALESGVNSDTDHSAYCVNPIRNDRPPAHREYSGSQGIARGDAVLSSAQAGVGLRSSAQTLQNSQAENLGLRAGSGYDTSSLQNNGGPMTDMTSILQNFCALISQQNEAHIAQVRQQNVAQNAVISQDDDRISQQNRTQNALISQLDDPISQQNESQNNMMRECLNGITNVVRENSASVNQCINGIAGQLSNLTGLIQNSCKQVGTREVTQVGLHENSTRGDTVTSVGSCRYTKAEASNGIRHSDNSNVNRPVHSVHGAQTEPSLSRDDRRDSLPAIHVSESQTNAVHGGQNDSSRHMPGNLCGPSDAPVLQTDGRGAVPRLATSDAHHTVFNPSESNIRKTNIGANTFGLHDACSRNRGVKLPVFSGNSSESWKVWFSRFSTIANLNNWDDSTRLSELLQRLHGTAAEFVFDEIPSELIGNFQSLVHELSLRFQTVETNKTFRA